MATASRKMGGSAVPLLPSALSRPLERAASRFARPINVSPTERWASAGAGAALAAYAAYGLSRRRFWSIPVGMIGAGLFWRGVTGHCDIYAALRIDRSRERAAHGAEAP